MTRPHVAEGGRADGQQPAQDPRELPEWMQREIDAIDRQRSRACAMRLILGAAGLFWICAAALAWSCWQ